MISLITALGVPISIYTDAIESVEVDPDCHDRCFLTVTSGRVHHIQRSFAYVTGILRAHDESAS
jgi:hypothetical protein